MIKFLQDAKKELEHVVWPTRAETKKYFTVVVSMIAICTVVLFVFGSSVTNALFAIRSVVTPPRPPVQDVPVNTDISHQLKTPGSAENDKKVSGAATPVSASGASVTVTPNK